MCFLYFGNAVTRNGGRGTCEASKQATRLGQATRRGQKLTCDLCAVWDCLCLMMSCAAMMPYTADSRPANASDFGACTGWYLRIRPFHSQAGSLTLSAVRLLHMHWCWQSLLLDCVNVRGKAPCCRSACLLADQAATNSAGTTAQSKKEAAILQAEKLCLDCVLTVSCSLGNISF